MDRDDNELHLMAPLTYRSGMSFNKTPDAILERLRMAAPTWTAAGERRDMEAVWELPTSTDPALRSCLASNSFSILNRYRVKRRVRRQVVDEIGASMASGYIVGRYLLGTGSTKPRYTTGSADPDIHAERINDRTGSWDYASVMGALGAEPSDLSRAISHEADTSPLLRYLGSENGRVCFLGAYCFGVSSALAEEIEFGPLNNP
jgi:hypothetical protein